MVLDMLCMYVLCVSGNDFLNIFVHVSSCKDGLCKSFSNIIKVVQLFDLIT